MQPMEVRRAAPKNSCICSTPHIERLQHFSRTRATDAHPRHRIEQRSMGCALQMMAVDGKKYTRHPVEFNAPVRTAVQENPKLSLPTKCHEASAILKIDPPAPTLLQLVKQGCGIEQHRATWIHQHCLSGTRLPAKMALALVATHPVYIASVAAGASGGAQRADGERNGKGCR